MTVVNKHNYDNLIETYLVVIIKLIILLLEFITIIHQLLLRKLKKNKLDNFKALLRRIVF